jgi:hypothetical protein
LRDDPAGFLSFVENLLATRHFDVLLPIHEQRFLFARATASEGSCRIGAAAFGSYRMAHSKAGFNRLFEVELAAAGQATRRDQRGAAGAKRLGRASARSREASVA